MRFGKAQLFWSGFSLEYCLRTLLNGTRDEGANAFSCPFGSSGDDFMGGIVQVSSNGVWKPFSRPTAFTAVAFPRHG